MRVVHITPEAYGCGGASIAALRIHRAMKASGIDSVIACWDRPDDKDAILLKISLRYRALRFCLHAFQKLISGVNLPTGLVPSGMARMVNELKPDFVVAHWLQLDTMSTRELSKLQAPVFWYHHDLWPILGLLSQVGGHIPFTLRWLNHLVRWNKRRVSQKMGDRLVPACASEWVARLIKGSGMFCQPPRVVPIPIDPIFRVGSRFPSDKFRILNGARGGLVCGLKGGDRLLKALDFIPEAERNRIEIVVFGEKKDGETIQGVDVRYVGRLVGEELSQQYRDADVFAFPSRYETFGQTKIESLACGTPVVAFDEAACAEGIVHKVTGWIAPADDIRSYAEGLMYFYDQWANGQPVRVPEDATLPYRPKQAAAQWQKALEDLAR